MKISGESAEIANVSARKSRRLSVCCPDCVADSALGRIYMGGLGMALLSPALLVYAAAPA